MIGRIIGVILLILGFVLIGLALLAAMATGEFFSPTVLILWFTGFPVAAVGFALAVPEQFIDGPR